MSFSSIVIEAIETKNPHKRGQATRRLRQSGLSKDSKNSIKAAISHKLRNSGRFTMYRACAALVDRA